MNLFIEGARGLGKSTITRKLRSSRMERILMNHTGLNGDTVETKEKMLAYYQNLNKFLCAIPKKSFTVIHDRSAFSEAVMCKEYKTTYTFDDEYISLIKDLDKNTTSPVVHLLLVNKNEEELNRNLCDTSRTGKALLFERSDIGESVKNTLAQQEVYLSLFNKMTKEKYYNSNFILLDVEGKSITTIVEEIEGIISTYS